MARIGNDMEYLTASLTTEYTVGSNVQATFIEICLTNHDSSVRACEVHFVPQGGSASDANQIIDCDLKAGELRIYRFTPYLDTGDFIQWKADQASKVSGKISVLEEST